MAKRKPAASTEAQWLAALQPVELMTVLQRLFSALAPEYERRIRLYAAACCRRIWPQLVEESAKAAVVAAEQFADYEITEEASLAASARARDRILSHNDERARCALRAATNAAFTYPIPSRLHIAGADVEAARAVSAQGDGVDPEVWARERIVQGTFLRDIFGNPFRPVTFDPAWRSSAAITLAQQMYDSRDFSAMPILADALQDAGCTNDDVLNHCRDAAGVHVRGCWVVDLVLGKS